MDVRLPAHLEVSALIRAIDAEGGFGTVLAKGERDAGTLMVLCCVNGTNGKLYERMPQLDGIRAWTCTKTQSPENPFEITEYWQRRKAQDSDLWILELDHPDAERLLEIDVAQG